MYAYVTLSENTRDKSNPKFPNCDCVTSVPSQLPDQSPRLPDAMLDAMLFVLNYYWATNEEWKLGDFCATFRQCLAPWLQENLANRVTKGSAFSKSIPYQPTPQLGYTSPKNFSGENLKLPQNSVQICLHLRGLWGTTHKLYTRFTVLCVTKAVEIFKRHLPPNILYPKNFDMNFAISRHIFANNFRKEQDIVNRKYSLKTTADPPPGGGVILCT